jgi:hypothetical protein
MRIIAGVSLALVVLLPDGAEAQRRGRYNEFSFSPYLGAYKDAYDLEPDGSDLGFLVGFKAGWEAGNRTNLHLNLGYAQADDVASRGAITSPVRDNQWVLLTGGGDFALVPGPTAIALAVDLGFGWRRTPIDEANGEIDLESDGWGTYEVVAPGLTLRHRFSPRTAFWLSLQDYIFDVLEDAEHSPALTVGLSFR